MALMFANPGPAASPTPTRVTVVGIDAERAAKYCSTIERYYLPPSTSEKDSMIQPVRTNSTVEEAVLRIEESILEGALTPGAWLREADLSEELGVSRNTLRQAFQALARRGLVEHRPHRGVRVATLDRGDVTDILRARRLLEDAALARCERLEELAERLAAIAGEIEAAASDGEWTRLVDLDLRFHREIVDALGSERIGRFFRDAIRELRLAFILVDRREARVSETLTHVPDHRAIADALARGDRDDARDRLARHLENTEALLLADFGDEPGGGP